MLIKYVKFTTKKTGDKHTVSSATYDITDYISSYTWGGSKGEVARKLDITLINAPNDPNVKDITLKIGSMIYLYDDNRDEIFRGYITDRERSNKETVTYTVYDLLFYTLKSKATYNFKGKTPEDITKIVCRDMQIPTGALATTNKKCNLLVKDKSIYEIIMGGYTKARKSTGNKYYAYTRKGKLCVGKMEDDWVSILLSDHSNITSASTKESMADVINRVKIYDDKGKLLKVLANEDSTVKYGIIQATYTKEKDKDPTNGAKALFSGISRTLELEAIGYIECVTGKCVKIKDGATGAEGKFYIESDSHTWKDGVHTMKLSLSLINAMDVQEVE